MRRLVVERRSPIAGAARLTAVFALYVVIIAVLLLRFGLVEVWPGLAALAGGLVLALIAALFALIAFVRIWRWSGPGGGKAFVGFSIAAFLLLAPVVYGAKAVTSPRLNDVTTDLVDPPAFSVARTERGPGANPLAYDPALAERQKQAYPSLYPVITDATPEEVHALVLTLVREHRWRLAGDRPLYLPGVRGRARIHTSTGQVEAVDKSLLLGLEDDIAIRVREQDGRTRVDMRSASRYGSIDFGKNAERIASFLEELRTRSLIPRQAEQ
jgi:hypothetical protein